MQDFAEFFHLVTGVAPYPYQLRVANEGLPPVLEAPTGTGKTGIVVAWLWRVLHGAPAVTPRRLVYTLPQRALVEQVAEKVATWLAKLSPPDRVALHVVMGGEGATQSDWRMQMHRPAVVVGTVDSLVSKALNRGYGIARSLFPIDFALVTNGAHWIVDEVQLCPESTTTLRQLAAFTSSYGTAEPFGLTCMTATVPWRLMSTVDNPAPADRAVVRITDADRAGVLGERLAARRTVRRLPAEAPDAASVAAQVVALHRPGTLTLVVVNTVKAARAAHAAVRKALGGSTVDCTLLHSRFRAADRQRLMARVTGAPGKAGHIVVATQVVEAGIDISAAVLVAEAAPWPSMVQRAGRCNRYAECADAQLWWLPPTSHHPYLEQDVAEAVAELTALEGRVVTGEELQHRQEHMQVAKRRPDVSVLRRQDLLALFDTTRDLSNSDVDVSPYVRDAEDSDVQLAWAVWQPARGRPDSAAPPDNAVAPAVPYRCRVPIGELARLKAPIWCRDQAAGRWVRVGRARPARPGEVLVVAAAEGGYDPETGFDPGVRQAVPDSPTLCGRVERAAGEEDAYGEDSAGDRPRRWVSLDEHLRDTATQVRSLLAAVQAGLPAGVDDAVTCAALVHDVGKIHWRWQDALCALASDEHRGEVDARRPWAKSNVDGQLHIVGGTGFRHELVSLLLLDGPLSGMLDGIADRDLTRYLVLAHHGKLRMQVRDMTGAASADPDGSLLGLADGEVVEVPPILDGPAGRLTVDLEPFRLGGDRSWTRTARALRERYGPFVLAYLETLVRVADWRASADEDLAADEETPSGEVADTEVPA